MTKPAIKTPQKMTAFPKALPAVCLDEKPKKIKKAAKANAIDESAFIIISP